MLPKFLVKQITDCKEYQLMFGKDGKGGALGKVSALASGGKKGIPAQITEYVEDTVFKVGNTIRSNINEKIIELEIQLRKEFNSVLDAAAATAGKAAAKGAPQLSDKINKLAKLSTNTKKALSNVIRKAEGMRESADITAHRAIKKCQEVYNKAKEYSQTIRSHSDKLIALISEGKSFSTEKKYRVGLMKGWSVVGKAAATVAVGAVPTPNVQTKASIEVLYKATGPDREGSIVEIFMRPSANLQTSTNSLGGQKTEIVFKPKLDELVPMMRCVHVTGVGQFVCIHANMCIPTACTFHFAHYHLVFLILFNGVALQRIGWPPNTDEHRSCQNVRASDASSPKAHNGGACRYWFLVSYSN